MNKKLYPIGSSMTIEVSAEVACYRQFCDPDADGCGEEFAVFLHNACHRSDYEDVQYVDYCPFCGKKMPERPVQAKEIETQAALCGATIGKIAP